MIIKMRGLSSAASAANAAIDHMRDWAHGTDDWVSMGVPTDGKTYGIPEGLIFSFPCTTKDGKYQVVQGLDMSDELTKEKIQATTEELLDERREVEDLLN